MGEPDSGGEIHPDASAPEDGGEMEKDAGTTPPPMDSGVTFIGGRRSRDRGCGCSSTERAGKEVRWTLALVLATGLARAVRSRRRAR
jgi:MYXO-CTERM domain-containing protein